ncbi:MAG: hypothetical protein ACOZNI_31635 [Myxococcota bacterium]
MILFAILGCTPPETDDTAKTGETDADTDADADTDTDTTSGNYVESQSPAVVGIRYAECSQNTDGEDIWIFQFDVNDPQSPNSVESGTITYLEHGEPDVAESLACAGGVCSGSFESTAHGLGCDLNDDDAFRVVIVDEDGYTSLPYEFTPD